MDQTLYTAKYVVTKADPRGSEVLRDGAVLVEGQFIREVGPQSELRAKYPGVPTAGGSDRMLLPGLINAHHHGNAVSPIHLGVADGPLELWLLARMGEKVLPAYESATLAGINLLKSGTTTVMLNHVPRSARDISESAREIIRGFRDVGLRVCYSLSLRLQNRLMYRDDEVTLASLPADLATDLRALLGSSAVTLGAYFDFYDKLAAELSDVDRDVVRLALSPANVMWCSDEHLRELKLFADSGGHPIHMHLLETMYQQRHADETYGTTAVAHLYDLGLLDSMLSVAHAIWLTPEDIKMIAESGAQVCHNPSSNLRLRSGIAPIAALANSGAVIAIGTDAMTLNDDDDMIEEMRLVHWLHRQPGLTARALSADEVLTMATVNSARAVNFAGEIGGLLPGYRADIVVLRLDRIGWSRLDETNGPVEAFLRLASRRDIDAVVVGGTRIVEGGRVLTVDEDRISARLLHEVRRDATSDERQRAHIVGRLAPFAEEFYSGITI